ncbi:MAG TPA: hypothetical protein DCL44_06915 [Elusimicrobia bacterium]|nr:hypothetical protein [Elusimicrobiota bacterium]
MSQTLCARKAKIVKPLYLTLISLCLLQGLSQARAEDSFMAPATGAGGRFLLLERPDPEQIPNAAQTDTAPARGSSLENMGSDRPLSGYSQEDWNRVRAYIETGRAPGKSYLPKADLAFSTATPGVLPPEVEFKDSGTSLSVTGRKVISLNYSGKTFMSDQKTITRPKSLSLFEITQQMQVRMQGKVGQKISVNVDYDDTKQDKQDISVVYQGDPNEVVQNVSFGDIDLSLPATEFVSYNKQLFGIRADLRSNRFKMTFVGSRTKGLTKTKEFTGNTQFQGVDLLDTNYLRRKYYDAAFRDAAGNAASGRLPIKAGSEKIYIDQQTQSPVDNITIVGLTASDLDVPTSTYTGRFLLLNPGVDYVMDYVKGIVTFNRTMNPQDAIIINYENANGTKLAQNSTSSAVDTMGDGLLKLIKTPSDIYISTTSGPLETGYRRELKTYYSIGQTNIVHDDGRGNFTIRVKDQNRNDVGTNLDVLQTYPNDMEVDFDQGIITLRHPFRTSAADSSPDPQLYSASPSSKRLIRVEYYYRFKTFLLEPSIVLQSESVMVDGVKLARNQDYFIDYDSGFITFYYPDKITQNSKIGLTYEVAPFGGVGNQSLIGGRLSYDLGKHISFGSTLLYQGGIKSNSVPTVTDLTNSMTVYEGDAQLKDLNIFGLKINLTGEVAQSKTNPNLNDYALIDNMEGVKQEDAPTLDKNYWFITANPTRGPADPNALNWNSADVKARDINPQATSDGTQQVLTVNYDFNISSEVSMVYPLSATGLDFSQKTALEIVMYGENSAGTPGPQFNIHFGQVNEDADGTGGQNFTCASGLSLVNAPKNEDLNCDGQVSSAEDIGWLYAPQGLSQARYGASNGRLDSEDLNRNGRLDAQDFTGGDFGYVNASLFNDTTDLSAKSKVDFSGWRTLQAPMPIASTESYKWSDIKQVRLSLTQTPGGATSGVIKIARLAAVGNTWSVQQSTTTGSLQTLAVNNVDNPGYTPIFSAGGDASTVFDELYGSISDQQAANNSRNLVEQTLSINYSNIASTSTAYVYRKFTRPIDISQHQQFRFLINPQGLDNGASFYLQLGDSINNFRVEVPIRQIDTGWRLITIDQEDLTGDNVPDVWVNGSNSANMVVSSTGSPSLQQISQMLLGIKTADGSSHSGMVYINEIHLAKPITRTGNARKVEGNFEVPGWMSFGGKHRYVDRGFQTPVSAVTNQDNEQDTGYLNFTRFSFFPMNFTAGKQLTVTPNTLTTGANNLVNSLQQGRVKTLNGTAAGALNIPALPKLGLNYSKNRTDYSLLSRRDDKDLYTASLSYPVPVNLFILPKSLNLNYSFGRSRVNYDASKLLNTAGLFGTDELTASYGAKLTFVPWNGSSLNPGYSLQQVKEKRTTLSLPATRESYPKSLQQTVELNSNFLIFKWLNPSFNYSVTTMENNNLNVTTVTIVQSSAVFNSGEIKTVTRNAQGGVSLTLNANSLMPSNKLLRSMMLSSNYQIQDGDSWQNVEKDYDTRSKLWLRSTLHPKNRFAQRNSITMRDTINSTQRWQPFEGFSLKGAAAALNTMSLTNSFTNSVQRSEVTGTVSKSINRTFPDLIVSLSQFEKLTHTRKWAQNATINLKYSHNTNEAVRISLDAADTYGMDMRFKLLNYMDTALSYNLRKANKKDLNARQMVQSSVHNDATLQGTLDYKKFRFTPKVDYVSDVAKGALGVTSQNTVTLTPSLLIKTDLQIPKGLKLPFFKGTLVLTNRIVWTTTLSYAIKTSPITIADNNRLFSLNSSADYELAKNLRMTFNMGLQRLWHKYLKEEEYLSYQAGSTLTFQF